MYQLESVHCWTILKPSLLSGNTITIHQLHSIAICFGLGARFHATSLRDTVWDTTSHWSTTSSWPYHDDGSLLCFLQMRHGLTFQKDVSQSFWLNWRLPPPEVLAARLSQRGPKQFNALAGLGENPAFSSQMWIITVLYLLGKRNVTSRMNYG